jgi:hypothetical protein
VAILDKDPGPDKPRPCCEFLILRNPRFIQFNQASRSVKVFDILYINLMGTTTLLTNKTLNVRLNTLKNLGLFHTVDGRLEFALQRIGKNATDVETFLQEVVEDRWATARPSPVWVIFPCSWTLVIRGEGLVLKRGISGYHLASRESRWWVKVCGLLAIGESWDADMNNV